MSNSNELTTNDTYEKNAELKTVSNVESAAPQKIPYPKHIFFIIGNEFCERFNYYGMKAILVLYLKNKLGFTEDDSTILYHIFSMLVYFLCIFGGILSDAFLGKFRTIFYLSIVYCVGSVVLSLGSIPDFLSPKGCLYAGLFFIALGSGGIKPCVSAFGGDQFKMPEQAKQAAQFFSLFYFSINAGSVISTTLTPIFREEVHCFGDSDCFPLAFGVPAILMIISLVFFLIGKSSYTYSESTSENMLLRMGKCIWHAIATKIRDRKTHPRENLLDYSIDKYGSELVNDTRTMLKILLLYLPLPLFWTLFDQQGSRWTFQANKMNGDLGFYVIKPDQIQMINPLLILVFIPVFEAILYPALSKIGIRRPLQKLTLGGFLAGVAFVLSALVEFQIESSPEKTVSMLWQVPQYFVITIGEVMFSVTGLSFSYEQAPESMKSVVQAFWLLTVAFGNLIFIIVAESSIFESRAYEFLLFAGLIALDMVIFMGLAYNYKNVKKPSPEKNEQDIPLSKLENSS